jgi:hypothetical protein
MALKSKWSLYFFSKMETEEHDGRWADLPEEIVRAIADAVGEPSARCSNIPDQIAQMRLVCRAWASALPVDGEFWFQDTTFILFSSPMLSP